MRATTKRNTSLPVAETVSVGAESKSKATEIFVTVRPLDKGIEGVITELRPLFNLKKAAETLEMSESWMRQQKVIPFVRIQNRKLFTQDALQEFIEKSTRGKSARG